MTGFSDRQRILNVSNNGYLRNGFGINVVNSLFESYGSRLYFRMTKMFLIIM